MSSKWRSGVETFVRHTRNVLISPTCRSCGFYDCFPSGGYEEMPRGFWQVLCVLRSRLLRSLVSEWPGDRTRIAQVRFANFPRLPFTTTLLPPLVNDQYVHRISAILCIIPLISSQVSEYPSTHVFASYRIYSSTILRTSSRFSYLCHSIAASITISIFCVLRPLTRMRAVHKGPMTLYTYYSITVSAETETESVLHEISFVSIITITSRCE